MRAAPLLLVGATALVVSLPFVAHLQADSFKALYDGRWIVHHGIPHREALTVMAHGRAWIDQQWLAELTFYGAWSLGGYAMVSTLALAAVAIAYVILGGLMLRRGASIGVTFCCATLAVLSLTGWQFIRSQDLALPLFAALLAICLIDSERPRPGRSLLLLLPLLVLWANIHGSVLLGALLAASFLSYRAVLAARGGLRRTAVECSGLAAACVLAPLATPYGLGIVHYYREFVGNPAMAHMAAEWAPARFPSFAFFELAVPGAAVLAALAACIVRRIRVSPVLLGTTALTGVAAALEAGSIVWFGMAASLLLADTAKVFSPIRVYRREALRVMAAAGVALSAVVAVRVVGEAPATYESLVPASVMHGATAYAAAHPGSLVLADNLSSSALLWSSPWLQGRIAFDARLEQYSPTALSRWLDFIEARRWPGVSGGYQILVGDSFYARKLVHRLNTLENATELARATDGVAVLNPAAVGRA